jgi:serine protease AprX
VSKHSSWRPTAPGSGVTWGGQPLHARRAATIAAAAAVLFGAAGPVTAQAAEAPSPERVGVIVRELPGAGQAPEHAVEALGGTVEQQLGLIDGFSASVPANRVDALRASAGVHSVTEDAALTFSSAEVDNLAGQPGSMYNIATQLTGAGAMWDAGYTGRGVDVAVIDSGVVPVDGLRTPGKVVNGPDLSFDGRICRLTACSNGPTYALDTYGHRTNLAGIIAGRDDAAPAPVTSATRSDFVGMAPDARIVSVKIADAGGRTDVSQAIAAIDWVIQNRKANGLNIRVLNLSFGTDGVQDYQLDPLTFAAEQAWHKGIVVVVAAGNDGYGTAKLNNPAYDPYVIAVGGADTKGTASRDDDVVPAWSSTGDGTRNPDVVAPGAGVVSLRVAGSFLDNQHPAARVGERFFRGSGTSQAAAVVSGAAALLLQQRPNATPDQIKTLLMGTATKLPAADPIAQGDGLIDLAAAKDASTPNAVQRFTVATGLGSLEAARGSVHVKVDGKVLRGEVDVRGRGRNRAAWAAGLRNGTNWNGITWSGITWSGIT